MSGLQPTLAPNRPFLDWPIRTDPSDWDARVALLGIRHSEPYAHDPFPNDQAKAPGAVRARSANLHGVATVDGKVAAEADILSMLATLPATDEIADRWRAGSLLPPKSDE